MASRVLVAVRVNVTPERAFEAFTADIGKWWRPSGLFAFTSTDTSLLSFEPGIGGRLVMTRQGGEVFEIGKIMRWEPPSHVSFTWRQQSFAADQATEVRVSFEPLGEQTRVTVEHLGWDTIPREHAARHGFPLPTFQLRHAEWWQALLAAFAREAASTSPPR